jgi:glyoxylase-like metal-dependent hydrolase (beta-lactamase superfamily II)
MMKKVILAALAAAASITPAVAQPRAQAPAVPQAALSLWRLDCGEIRVTNLDVFSDTFLYQGREKTLTDSCYLIRNGNRYLLWDTGLGRELIGRSPGGEGPFRMSMRTSIRDQLQRIGVRPEQVNFVGISHYHGDHIGQAADFPAATLLIGSEDWEAIRGREDSAARFQPWITGGGKVQPLQRDHDVFGDGSVIMIDTPGHTPGHHALLVRLPQMGPVLLTGDLYHFHENMTNGGVPSFNTDRSDTLASFDRFQQIARSLGATIIIQHEPADVSKLPAFPQAAR